MWQWPCKPLPSVPSVLSYMELTPALGEAVGHHQLQWCLFVMESVSLWVADAWTELNSCSLIMTFSPSKIQQQPNPVTQHWDSLFYYQPSEPLCSPHVLSTYLTCYSCARCYTIVKRAASISSMNSYFKDNNSAVKMCSGLKLYKEDLSPRVILSGQKKGKYFNLVILNQYRCIKKKISNPCRISYLLFIHFSLVIPKIYHFLTFHDYFLTWLDHFAQWSFIHEGQF